MCVCVCVCVCECVYVCVCLCMCVCGGGGEGGYFKSLTVKLMEGSENVNAFRVLVCLARQSTQLLCCEKQESSSIVFGAGVIKSVYTAARLLKTILVLTFSFNQVLFKYPLKYY